MVHDVALYLCVAHSFDHSTLHILVLGDPLGIPFRIRLSVDHVPPVKARDQLHYFEAALAAFL